MRTPIGKPERTNWRDVWCVVHVLDGPEIDTLSTTAKKAEKAFMRRMRQHYDYPTRRRPWAEWQRLGYYTDVVTIEWNWRKAGANYCD